MCVVLCCVVLCCVVLCRVVSCRVVSCRVVSCRVMLLTKAWFVPAVPKHARQCHALSWNPDQCNLVSSGNRIVLGCQWQWG